MKHDQINHTKSKALKFILILIFLLASLGKVQPAPVFASAPVLPSVSVGGEHTCARTPAGAVKCWGDNTYGQLGDNTTTSRSTILDVYGLSSGMKAVSSGSYHTCALTNAGGVKCWGYNNSGQLGNNSIVNSSIPVNVSGLDSGVSAISSGFNHTCALMTTGGVKCWGANSGYQLGIGNQDNQLVPVDVHNLSSGVSAVSSGGEHTCALMLTGVVKCWGNNDHGQAGVGANSYYSEPVEVSGLSSGVTSIAAGNRHTCALTTSRGVKCWGDETFGQLGNNIKADLSTFQPQDVLESTGPDVVLSGVSSLSAGDYHTCAVAAGAVKCWGANYSRQLGDGSTESNPIPVTTSGLTSGWAAVEGGMYHTCAVSSIGVVKCWGSNNSYQLGDGTTDNRDTPVYAGGPPSISPSDGSTVAQGNSSVTLKWKLPVFASKQNVSKYHIQASADSGFISLLKEKTQTGTSLAFGDLMPNTSYFWRVQAVYKDGSFGSWTSAAFKTNITKALKLGAPGNNSKQTKTLVNFTWSKPAGTPKAGYQYVLQYSTDPNFASYTEVKDLLKTTNSSDIAISNPPVTIYWRVRLLSADGAVNFSDFSATGSFLR
ncbi:MAG: fibronectin type III domain-containing protein [Chloroflexota bacterium]